MVIKRRDFQKAAAFIHEFLLKMNEDVECAELRDTLNLALLHMQKYYRALQSRSQEKNAQHTLSLSARGLSPMTPFVDAPDKFRWRWVNLDNARLPSNMSVSDSINLTTLPPMIRAVKAGNINIIQELMQQDPATVDDIDGLGRTGLMYAVHCGEHNVLNFLLENRADINVTAHDGSTAMHHACHEGNVVALSLLLDHGADMRILDVQGRASMHWAVTTPSTECLEMLLENCADPAIRDKDGLTPCMWACRMDNFKHFELLCRSEYTITEPDGIERDANGRTWMHWAVRRTEPLECLQTLLTSESATYKDEEGKTVLMLAAEIGSLAAARLIIEIAGPDCVNDYDYQGRNALHLATIGGHGDVVNFLLEQGADINIADKYNATPWDYARNRQLHYCQLIIMSHQRQRMMSNPTSPLPNGLGLFMHSENGVQEDFSRMSFRTRSDQSTPVTPPHPPKRPRTNRMLPRRTNSLTSQDRDLPQNNNQTFPGRISNSAGHERKKERLEVSVNTRSMTNTAFLPGRQDSMLTDDTDMMNVMNDVEINGDEDIDNEPHYNQDEGLTDLPEERPSAPQPMPLNPPPSNKPTYSVQPQAPPRPTLRSQQQYRGRGAPVPSPPNMDPQRPHMIRQQQPLPPRTTQRETTTALQPPPGGAGDAGRGEQVASPPLSSQSSDQISSRTQISPRGYAAPLHPQQGRVHSAIPPHPKYSKGQPQHHDARYVDENVEEDDKPPVINGFAVPIREGTMRSARPGQRSVPMETDDSVGMSTDAGNDNYHAEGVKDAIAEEEEADELGVGPLIPPPQAFRGASQQGGRPLAQSIPQDKSTMRMAPTSAKPPLPRSNRNSASVSRRSSDKNVSPGRRSRPPTSKSSMNS
ncbi:hypothetical protein BaRGS_00027211 [Batillaria attramentaria]|uniref:Uncharacterized protein n=1 Tax=Batillaria attramentaria TaxID=370345 RepID=A0ABD0K425_9CAEN